MPLPEQKPGRSKQDYGTPKALISAVEKRFGPMGVDLAASAENAKVPLYFSEAENSLSIDWVTRLPGFRCWLNPPFADIAPWAAKCADYAQRSTGRIFLLTPASVGANWYAKHVDGQAYVIALQGRLTFEGETTPYPKDCILSVFGSRVRGFEVWDWRRE